MKASLNPLLLLLPLGLPLVASAQTSSNDTRTAAPATSSSPGTVQQERARDRSTESWNDGQTSIYGPSQGDYEFSFGGNGSANRDFDSSGTGVSASFGYYFTDTMTISVRQSVNHSNPDNDGSSWSGSTRAALDYHFINASRLRPFVGVNFGGVYGDNTNESFIGGIEGGLKYYIMPRAFIFGMVEYAWSFKSSREVDDNFSDGGYLWTFGIGLTF